MAVKTNEKIKQEMLNKVNELKKELDEGKFKICTLELSSIKMPANWAKNYTSSEIDEKLNIKK